MPVLAEQGPGHTPIDTLRAWIETDRTADDRTLYDPKLGFRHKPRSTITARRILCCRTRLGLT